jgi:GAF domain-containing protein
MPTDVALTARAARAKQMVDAVLSADDTSHLDALVARASDQLGVTGAHLSMLTDRQVTAASGGALLAVSRRGAEIAFDDTICANTLRAESMLAIPNAAVDPRVSSIPAVQKHEVAAYLGLPLRQDGLTVAVLCAFDDQPREWSDADIMALSELADEVLAELVRLEAVSNTE